MTSSTVNPAPVTIRKAQRDDGDWLYIYIRDNVSQRTETDEDGEQYTLYEYDELQLAVPMPDHGFSVPTSHSVNQVPLKRDLLAAIQGDANSLRGRLTALMARSDVYGVDADDNLTPYEGPLGAIVSRMRLAQNWATHESLT